jgi:tetratricopeptide (TPR) repeat protein
LYYLLPMERFDEAAAECRRSLLDDPMDLTARIRFAQCLSAAGRKQDAYAELHRVLGIDENLWFTHFILGLHQLSDGQLAEAGRHAERAQSLAPWSPSANGSVPKSTTPPTGRRGSSLNAMLPYFSSSTRMPTRFAAARDGRALPGC